MDNKTKILVLDIETSLMQVYVWDIKDQYINPGQIKKDWHLMAWAAKWLDEPASKAIYRDQRNAKSIENDKALLIDLWKLLDEADIVITQNGKNFDGPKLNARFIMHGMKPPSPYRHLDTYQIVKSVAKFTSNSLDYLTNHLNVKYKKLSHAKFPGTSLWLECEKGNLKAWEEMKTYNIHDVLSTEELYNKIKAWAPMNAPKPFLSNCRVCGHATQRRGFTLDHKKQRVVCTSPECGSWDTVSLPKVKKLKKEAA